jgi:integrase/recombinase XerD
MSQTAATAQPISPLRRRIIEDMTVRGIGEKTQSDYIRHVKNFTSFSAARRTWPRARICAFQVLQREQGVQERRGGSAAVLFSRRRAAGLRWPVI